MNTYSEKNVVPEYEISENTTIKVVYSLTVYTNFMLFKPLLYADHTNNTVVSHIRILYESDIKIFVLHMLR